MRRLLFFLTLGASVLLCVPTAFSQNYYLSHCDGEMSTTASLTVDGAKTISVATLFSAEELGSLKGSEITSLRIGIVSKLKISDVSAWVASSLDGERLGEAMIRPGDLKSGWNEVELTLPVEISGEPLYLGYTFTQPSKCNVISVLPSSTAFPLFMDEGDGWADMTEAVAGALCVEASVSGESLAEYEIRPNSIELLDDTVEEGAKAYLRIDFTNRGTREIHSLDYEIATEEGVYSFSETFGEPVASRERKEVYSGVPVGSREGINEITFRPVAIDGSECTAQPEYPATVEVVRAPYLKHRVLIEDFSNENCSNCPSGAEKLDKVIADGDYAGVVDVVVHHAGSSYDRYTVDASKEYEVFYSGQLYSPMTMFNRSEIDGTLNFVPSTESDIRSRIERSLAKDVFLSLSIDPAINPAKGMIEIKASGSRTDALPEERLALTAFLTEDGIISLSQLGAHGPYTHNNMLRSVSSVWGESFSFDADGRYEATLSLPFDAGDWDTANCRIIVFISDDNPLSPGYHNILQSASLPLPYAAAKAKSSGLPAPSEMISKYGFTVNGGLVTVDEGVADFMIYDINGLPQRKDVPLHGLYLLRLITHEGDVYLHKILL